jgi:hypothetical protein
MVVMAYTTRRAFLLQAACLSALAQEEGEKPVEFLCPMDKDIRALQAGKCPRCGMALVPGIPDSMEYGLDLALQPAAPKPGQKTRLTFTVRDPNSGKPVRDFEVMHEKLFHLFLISQDLEFFAHEHPVLTAGGSFRYECAFPKPGMYRVLGDFYPKGGTPQLISKTVIVPGGPVTPGGVLKPDIAPRDAANLRISLALEPAEPIAGMKTLMFFKLDPADGLEPYLGAWGHMLAASADLVDMIHAHPFLADGGPQAQFNMFFPRPGVHRVWVQFQRRGVVNTAAFNVPVSELK